jgi:hypothetical protein
MFSFGAGKLSFGAGKLYDIEIYILLGETLFHVTKCL